MARIAIEIDDREVRRGLRNLADAGEDLSPAMRVVSELLLSIAEESFEREASPEGEPWTPLAAGTRRQRRKEGKDGPILQRDRHLRRSLDSAYDRTSAVAGTNLAYAAIHQFGGRVEQSSRNQVLAFAARGGRFTSRRAASRRTSGAVRVAFATIGDRTIEIPARPFLGVGPSHEEQIVDALQQHIANAWLEAAR